MTRLDDKGKRGALIFTSATAAWRGNKTTSAFSAGKHGERALAQSLNKEFGVQNIHVSNFLGYCTLSRLTRDFQVSNVIVDGAILNGRLEKLATDKSILADVDKRLDPASIAAVRYSSCFSFELNTIFRYFVELCVSGPPRPDCMDI
jgi:NAD(P)-dependent dehydrogenase (short-subunit alcohol dehydrogenase family)